MKEKVIAAFEKLATVYEHSIDTKSLYNREYERPSMLRHLPDDLTGNIVLDAGCAAGWYTEQLLRRNAKVVATDISPEMVDATKRRIGDKAEVLQHDLEINLPLQDQTFDYIISSLTLHYIKDWNNTFQEFRRILKPTGKLLFSVHHPFTDIRMLQNYEYFNTELIVDQWNKEGKLYEVPFYRRSLQSILNTTLHYFHIEKITEPVPTKKFKELSLHKYHQLLNNPQFLIIEANQI